MPDFLSVGDVGTTTWYEGSAICTHCGRVLTPVERLYGGTLCPSCVRLDRQRLLANKRVEI